MVDQRNTYSCKQTALQFAESDDSRKTSYTPLRITAIIILFFLALMNDVASIVNAAPFTFEFSGEIVDDHLDNLFPGKSFGDPYHGTFTVDTDAVASSISPEAATYDSTLR